MYITVYCTCIHYSISILAMVCPYKTLCSIVHQSQLEPVQVLITAGHGYPQCIGWYGHLTTVLELGEQHLELGNNNEYPLLVATTNTHKHVIMCIIKGEI